MVIGESLAWRFDRLTDGAVEKLLIRKNQRSDRQPEKDERLYCSACSYPITRKQDRTSVNGAHEHHFTNPHGISFRVGCYGEAPGCRAMGEATDQHTWFPGHAWRVVVCASCQQHLGWDFQARDTGRFFGLIIDRLSAAR